MITLLFSLFLTLGGFHGGHAGGGTHMVWPGHHPRTMDVQAGPGEG